MNMESIELELRKQAEILGDLNMQLNKYIEENQQVSRQIVQLENRIAKKRKLIEQQNKDKKIIHQKLIHAENYKQYLQISANGTPGGQSEMTPNGNQAYEEVEMVRPASLKEFKEIPEEKKQKIQVVSEKHEKVKKMEQKQQDEQYENADKGQYVPPVLSFDDKSQSSSDNQNEDEMLENVRKKLEGTDMDAEDDDD